MFLPAVQERAFVGKSQISGTYDLPFPVGGINARDGLTDMPKLDAIALTNVFPEAGYGVVRGGHTSWATGITGAGALPGAIRTLMVWRGATDQLFASIQQWIYDATDAGNRAGVPVQSGFTSADFQWTNFKNAGGQYLLVVNGADSMRAYDGATWTTPAITGVASSTFENVVAFKERLWFAQHRSLDLWYLPLQAIAGAALVFPLGSVFRRGGYVTGLGTFSRDAGQGIDDFLIIITNNGEIAVYQGTDPSSANTFALAGTFEVGKPMGRRATTNMSGDLTIITQDGVVSMAALLQYGREAVQKAAVTGKIQTLFSQYSQSYFSNFGWQPTVFPAARYLVVNVPAGTNASQFQIVMNTITGSWCTFTGMAAGCWAVANNMLFFGGNASVVYQANSGYLDNLVSYNWNIQTSWQMPGGATNKHFKMIKATTLVDGGTAFNMNVDVDFVVTTVAAPAASFGAGAVWPMTWPWTWVGTGYLSTNWRTVGSIGTWSNVNMTGLANGGGAQINSFEIVYEVGGPL